MTTLIFTPPPQKKDALALEMDKMDSEKTTEDLTNTLKEILAFFPREDQDLFVELLKFVPDEQIYGFIKFVDKYSIKDSPMMQMMLLNFFAPFKAKLSALDIAKSSGEMYNDIMHKHANEFFGGLEDKLKVFIVEFNTAVDKKLGELNTALNSHTADMKTLQISLDKIESTAKESIKEIEKATRKGVVEIQHVEAQTVRDKEKTVSEISKEVNKQVLHTVNSWTSWLGGIFLFGIVFISMFSALLFAKYMHLFN